MPRPETTRVRFRTDLPQLTDVRDVIGSVNATLDAILAATIPVLTRALAQPELPARSTEPRDESKSRF